MFLLTESAPWLKERAWMDHVTSGSGDAGGKTSQNQLLLVTLGMLSPAAFILKCVTSRIASFQGGCSGKGVKGLHPSLTTTHNSLQHGGDAHRSGIKPLGGEISPVKLTFVGSSPTSGVAKQQFKAKYGVIQVTSTTLTLRSGRQGPDHANRPRPLR